MNLQRSETVCGERHIPGVNFKIVCPLGGEGCLGREVSQISVLENAASYLS